MPHVAVVGAGLSGLRCADVLLRSGAKVTILEARNRLGGRVHQYVNAGHTVDLGPNWIHGTSNNPIKKLAAQTESVLVDPGERQMIFASNGALKPDKESLELGTAIWETVVDAFKYSNKHYEKIDPQLSLMDFFRTQLTERFGSDREKLGEMLEEAASWGFFVGEDVERQSLRCFFLEECLDGENVIVASTYERILAAVAKKAVDEAEIKYNEEVTKIDYRTEGDQDGDVVVTTRRGASYKFDEVVVTCPLGWLKRNRAVFSPALPLRLSQAIDNISYGRLEKLYITFPSAWWLDRSDSEASSPASNISLDAASLGDSISPMLMHYHQPDYHPDPASKDKRNGKWNQCIVSFAHLPGSTAHPTLLFYLYGPCGTYITSLLAPHAPHSPQYNALLASFAQPFFSRLPGYSPSDSSCAPLSYLITQWQQDPFAGNGSYSNFQIGLERGDLDIETMRSAGGLSEAGKGLWIAGEHVAPFVAVGTTTGAYWSGEAVGRKIAERYGLEVKLGHEEDVLLEEHAAAQKKDITAIKMGGTSLSGLAM